MYAINVRPDEILRQNNSLKQQYSILSEIRRSLASIHIDSKIRARRDIQHRLSEVQRKIEDLEQKAKVLTAFVDHSMASYRTAETKIRNSLPNSALRNYSTFGLLASTTLVNPTKKASALKDSEKWAHGESKAKEAFLGMTDFDWLAPIAGTNWIGTLLDVGATSSIGLKVLRGYEVLRDKKSVKIKPDKPIQRKKNPKGRPRATYKIYSESYIESQAKKGNYVEAAQYSKNLKLAAGSAVRDKLGWASIVIDNISDTRENFQNNESNSKIAGDILGNTAVGVGTLAVGGAAVALLPVTASVAAVAAVGLGVSVGLTYVTEGIKWNVDWDKDGEDDSIKDMVKTGFKKGIDTVAGWFK